MKFNFKATHGVAIMSGEKVVADFERVRGGDTVDGLAVYGFGTDDAKVAEIVRATEGFGIVEAKTEPASKAPAKP
jgi:hypothetical protein